MIIIITNNTIIIYNSLENIYSQFDKSELRCKCLLLNMIIIRLIRQQTDDDEYDSECNDGIDG